MKLSSEGNIPPEVMKLRKRRMRFRKDDSPSKSTCSIIRLGPSGYWTEAMADSAPNEMVVKMHGIMRIYE